MEKKYPSKEQLENSSSNTHKIRKNKLNGNIIFKDVKEINIIFLILIGVFLIGISGTSSYAIFSGVTNSNNKITGVVKLNEVQPNPPLLTSNMIPVYYDATNNVWKKADSSNSNNTHKWYNYGNKMWANAVTVNDYQTSLSVTGNYSADERIVDIYAANAMIYNNEPTINEKGEATFSGTGTEMGTPYGPSSTFEELCTAYNGNAYIDYLDSSRPYTKVQCDDAYNATISEYNIRTGARDTYQKASVGTAIPMDDINAMFVWIPRYKYTYLTIPDSIKCSEIENPNKIDNPECYTTTTSVPSYQDSFHDQLVEELINVGFISTQEQAEEVITDWKNGEPDRYNYVSYEDYVLAGDSFIKPVTETVFNGNTNIKRNPEFKIEFEENTSSTGTIKCTEAIEASSGASETCIDNVNGSLIRGVSTYTHPAFTFDNKQLTGIWVGKFKNSANSGIFIKPNKTSYSPRISESFIAIRKMEGLNNIHGFEQNATASVQYTGEITGDSNKLDTHMMKNMEWGAVAYFSHSKYGTCIKDKCKSVGLNNNSEGKTGCGAETRTMSTTACNEYNTDEGQKASTTRNIYGIYDMSGGSSEYVMGNIFKPDDTMTEKDAGNWSYQLTLRSKYYDAYSYGVTINGLKLGDATKELSETKTNWYQANISTASYSYPWFNRGGNYNTGNIFSSSGGTGGTGAKQGGSSHTVLIITQN